MQNVSSKQIICPHCYGRPFGRGMKLNGLHVFVCLNCGHKLKFGPEKAVVKDERNWLFEVEV